MAACAVDLHHQLTGRNGCELNAQAGPAEVGRGFVDAVAFQVGGPEIHIQHIVGMEGDVYLAGLVGFDHLFLIIDGVGDGVLQRIQQRGGGGVAVFVHHFIDDGIIAFRQRAVGVYHIAVGILQLGEDVHIRLIIGGDAGGRAAVAKGVGTGLQIFKGDHHTLQGGVDPEVRFISASAASGGIFQGVHQAGRSAAQAHIGHAGALQEQDHLAHGHIKCDLIDHILQLVTAEDHVAHLRQPGQDILGVPGAGHIIAIGAGLDSRGANTQIHGIDRFCAQAQGLFQLRLGGGNG